MSTHTEEELQNLLLGDSVDDEESIGLYDESTDTEVDDNNEDEDEDDNESSADADDEQDEDQGAQEGSAEDTAPQEKQADVKAAKNGDLVDAKGNVIAKAGVERRHFERAQKMSQVAQQLQQQNEQLREQVVQARYINKLPQALDLNEQEAEAGLKLMASFKKDPVKTVQTILTQARAMGHNIEVPQGIDMGAVQQMLDQRLAPLIGERQANIEQTLQVQQAQQAAAQFLAEYPDAATHENMIAQVMRAHREVGKPVTVVEAYYKLKTWALENGYDWSTDLVDQREARTRNPPQQKTQQQPPQTKPRNVRAAPNTGTLTDRPAVVSSNTEWATIINDSLKEVLKGG